MLRLPRHSGRNAHAREAPMLRISPRNRWLRFNLLVALAVAASMIGCTSRTATPSTPAPATVKIGAVVPLTGRYASLGEQVKNGYELAFDDVNKAGGVMVRDYNQRIRLELKLLDDESDATKTVQRLEAHNADQVVALLGGAGSDLHAASAAVAEKNKTPYLGVAFALYQIHQRQFKYLFSPFPKSPGLAKMTFEMMESLNPKPTRVAIFAEKTDWGTEMQELWKKEASAKGFQVVTDETYAPGSQDFAPMIIAAKGANADAVLALPTPPDGMAIAKQMKELDFNPRLMYFIRAPDGLIWPQNLARDGDYFIHSAGWSSQVKFPGAQEMVQQHQTKYNKGAESLTGAAYAAVQVLAAAIEKSGRLDRDAVRDAIAGIDLPQTVAGPVKFNADGTGQVVVIATQWQNGKSELIWPRDLASAQLAYPAPAWRER
jgi:branched-chain amino acid transport system substrate-binding protein